MRTRNRVGFTIIEMMIAIVVGAMLMTALVGLSGSVQRSFGRSKDITDLQANLRFSMMRLADDLRRAAFMYYADPQAVSLHFAGSPLDSGWSPTGSFDAIEFDPAAGLLTLRGNYGSSRDYFMAYTANNQGTIMCRDKSPFNPDNAASPCGFAGSGGQKYDAPFADGMPFDKLFNTGEMIRLYAGEGRYTYHVITSTAGVKLDFMPAADRALYQQGEGTWISPVHTIQFVIRKQSAESNNWILERQATNNSEVAEFLLPPTNDPNTSGFYLRVYNDISATANFKSEVWQPEIAGPLDIAAAADVDPLRIRAVEITIRGRTEDEDPDFILANYGTDPGALNFGFDLDGNPENGLAHVRVERTVVQLKNMGLNLTM